jgi:hypothetical protein
MEPLAPHQHDTAGLVHAFRAWYEVCRETAVSRDGRRTVAVEVRLWAMLPRGAVAMPGAPASRGACLALTRLAEAVVARAERGAEAEIEPFRSALYDSRAQPGRDEIYLAVALRSRGGLSPGGHDDRERRLREVRRRLEALGVFEGGWREPPRPAAPEGKPDAWEVRTFHGATPRPVRQSRPGPHPAAPGPEPRSRFALGGSPGGEGLRPSPA